MYKTDRVRMETWPRRFVVLNVVKEGRGRGMVMVASGVSGPCEGLQVLGKKKQRAAWCGVRSAE